MGPLKGMNRGTIREIRQIKTNIHVCFPLFAGEEALVSLRTPVSISLVQTLAAQVTGIGFRVPRKNDRVVLYKK